MNSDLVRIIIIGAVALGLFYVVTNYQPAIQNDGEVSVDSGVPEGYAQPNGNGKATQLPSFRPSDGQPQVDSEIADLNAMSAQSQFRKPNTFIIQPGQEPARANQLNLVKQNTNVLPYPQYSNNYGPQASVNNQFQIKTGKQPALDCFPKDTVTPQELMPREDPYNTWSQVNPTTQGHLADRNFLESGHHFGINTQGNSLRNANKQLRSDPPIPQVPVGPWLQSTIEPDTNRRAFEIGGDY
jgi:hypothetical protein